MAFSSPMVPETKMNGTPGLSRRAACRAARPSKAGIEKSARMTSGRKSRSASAKAAAVQTTCWTTRKPAPASARIASSASTLLSSAKRRRRSLGAMLGLDQAVADGDAHQRGKVVDLELGHDAAAVRVDA